MVRLARRSEAAAVRPPEGDELVGDLDAWVPDPDFLFPSPAGMQIVIDLAPDEAELVRRAVRAGDEDFVGFAQRAVVEAARAAAGGGEAPALLTLPAAAARFGVKRDRLQRAAMEGRLPARKLDQGRTAPWLVRAEDVERFLRESRRGPQRRVPA